MTRAAESGHAGRNAGWRSSLSSPARAVLLFLAVLAGLVAPARTQAQNWRPDRPIRLIIPFPPGGTMDVITRLLAEPAARLLGQPVVPENRPGANGNIGIVATARSHRTVIRSPSARSGA